MSAILPIYTFLEQADRCEGLTDADIDCVIPDDYWLTQCKYALTVKVHRSNECFIKKPADAPAGDSRKVIRKKDRDRMAVTRREDAEQCEASINARTQSQMRDLKMKEKLADEALQRSMMKRQTEAIKNCERQLNMLGKMKEDFIELNGEDAYKEKLRDLMQRMFNAQSAIETSAMSQAAVGAESNGDANEDDNADDEVQE